MSRHLRNERGAISGAEGCMFFAMFLFAALLIGLLVVAFFRFREPPQQSQPGGAPVIGQGRPASDDRSDWQLATGDGGPAKPHG
jgi:hypothetical protein